MRLSKTFELSTDLTWCINYIQCCVPLILEYMETLTKLAPLIICTIIAFAALLMDGFDFYKDDDKDSIGDP